MREARYVSLIPRTTLHRDSEQVWPFFITTGDPMPSKISFIIFRWRLLMKTTSCFSFLKFSYKYISIYVCTSMLYLICSPKYFIFLRLCVHILVAKRNLEAFLWLTAARGKRLSPKMYVQIYIMYFCAQTTI